VPEPLAQLAEGERYAELAKEKGLDPPSADPSAFPLPSGRPIAAVFMCDVSGSMDGSRIIGVREALLKGADFIDPENAIGVVSFADDVRILLPIKPFDLNQKSSFLAAAQSLSVGGQTAM
jgi:hypothetical protein